MPKQKAESSKPEPSPLSVLEAGGKWPQTSSCSYLRQRKNQPVAVRRLRRAGASPRARLGHFGGAGKARLGGLTTVLGGGAGGRGEGQPGRQGHGCRAAEHLTFTPLPRRGEPGATLAPLSPNGCQAAREATATVQQTQAAACRGGSPHARGLKAPGVRLLPGALINPNQTVLPQTRAPKLHF